MSRTCFRNKQPFWYALYAGTVADCREDEYGNPLQVGTHATYENPVQMSANISPAKGSVIARQFGDDDQYDKVIVTGDRDTPIDEYAVLWIDVEPELDENGALKVNADGEIVTPWDYIVRKVGRGLPNFGSTVIGISKVTVA
jgi:hypothetical protein